MDRILPATAFWIHACSSWRLATSVSAVRASCSIPLPSSRAAPPLVYCRCRLTLSDIYLYKRCYWHFAPRRILVMVLASCSSGKTLPVPLAFSSFQLCSCVVASLRPSLPHASYTTPHLRAHTTPAHCRAHAFPHYLPPARTTLRWVPRRQRYTHTGTHQNLCLLFRAMRYVLLPFTAD